MGTAGPQPRDLVLAVEVRRCPLRSGARGRVLAEIWSSRLRSAGSCEEEEKQVEAGTEEEEKKEKVVINHDKI